MYSVASTLVSALKSPHNSSMERQVERIKRTNEQLRQSLEALLSAPKK